MNFKRYLKSVMVAVVLLFLATTACANQPKYVFFFLGDGMASSQIQATEAYLTTLNGGKASDDFVSDGTVDAADLLKPENRLNMSKMRVQGMQTTYDAHALMTDSASAGTAFACGAKTKSGTIGMDETLSTSLKSVAQLAHEQGKKVGILSSVSLDHATPASYYASVTNRGYMNSIATQMAESGYEFFGGGGLASPTGPAREGDTENNVLELLTKNGYEVLQDRKSILALKGAPKEKVVCINPNLADSAAMPYAIDKPADNFSLAEMTEVAIATLYDGRRGRGRGRGGNEGFFIMVEGGKIDWACHANDAMATIGDMIDFDDAVGVALEFMRWHPLQTLIVVTGDHETGGMTIGHATTGYKAYYERLLGQTKSYEHFEANEWAAHKAAYADYNYTQDDNLATDATMLGLMESAFGLKWEKLNDYQKEQLERAYDWSMTRVYDSEQKKWISGSHADEADKNNLLYGGYEPIIVTITHILNENASIGWTSYSHTGVPVPVFAEGREALRFAGFYDNTDIAKKLARAMGIRDELPATKQ